MHQCFILTFQKNAGPRGGEPLYFTMYLHKIYALPLCLTNLPFTSYQPAAGDSEMSEAKSTQGLRGGEPLTLPLSPSLPFPISQPQAFRR